MKKIIVIIIGVLIAKQVNSQTVVGVNVDLGNGNAIGATDPFYTTQALAWGIGADLLLNTSKRFNLKLNIGFQQKGYIENFKGTFYGNPYPVFIGNELIVTNVTQNCLHLDLGFRFNILNKKNKLFIDASMCNNMVLSTHNSRKVNNILIAKEFNSSLTSPYYVSANIGIGFNFNSIFSISVFANPAITSVSDTYYSKRINMFGINLNYYLPIFGNKKAKTPVTTP